MITSGFFAAGNRQTLNPVGRLDDFAIERLECPGNDQSYCFTVVDS